MQKYSALKSSNLIGKLHSFHINTFKHKTLHMKNSIFIFLNLFLSTQLVTAQNYESIFGDQSTQWNITFGNLWGMATAKHNIVGDTVINGKHYRVVNGYDNTENIMGFLREDSTHSRAWYMGLNDMDEHLIMDLNLNIGDSMFINGIGNISPQYYYVDSVYTHNGRKHIRFDLEIDFIDKEKFTVIEGVTSNMGFRYQDMEYINAFPTILLCAFKDDIQIYGIGDCIISSVTEKSEIGNIDIFPNPFQDILNLKFHEIENSLTVSIYDLNGKKLISEKMDTSGTHSIHLGNLSAGVYIIKITDQNGSFYHSSKLIKSK